MSLSVKKLAYWLPALIWMSLIFFFSSQPTVQASTIDVRDFFIKKLAHVVEYFILAILIDYSLRHTTHFSRTKRLIFTLLFVVVYASSDEFHQSFTPGREPHIRDVIIDILGGSIGFFSYRYLKTVKSK
jgi:VanZ family protein